MVAITFPNDVFGFSGLIHACVSLMDFFPVYEAVF